MIYSYILVGYIICLPLYWNIFFHINSNQSTLFIDWYSHFNFCIFTWVESLCIFSIPEYIITVHCMSIHNSKSQGILESIVLVKSFKWDAPRSFHFFNGLVLLNCINECKNIILLLGIICNSCHCGMMTGYGIYEWLESSVLKKLFDDSKFNWKSQVLCVSFKT